MSIHRVSVVADTLFFIQQLSGQQDRNDSQEGRERHKRDGDVSDPEHDLGRAGDRFERTEAAFGSRVDDGVVVEREEEPDTCEAKDGVDDRFFVFQERDTEDDSRRIHEDALKPAQVARHEPGELGVIEAPTHRDEGHDERHTNGGFWRKIFPREISHPLEIQDGSDDGKCERRLRQCREDGEDEIDDGGHRGDSIIDGPFPCRPGYQPESRAEFPFVEYGNPEQMSIRTGKVLVHKRNVRIRNPIDIHPTQVSRSVFLISANHLAAFLAVNTQEFRGTAARGFESIVFEFRTISL